MGLNWVGLGEASTIYVPYSAVQCSAVQCTPISPVTQPPIHHSEGNLLCTEDDITLPTCCLFS